MKILLIGNGAREHIIAEKLKASPKCKELLVYANKVNPGIKKLASIYHVGKLDDVEAIRNFAKENKPAFAIVGPENPIADGVVNALSMIGIPSVAPMKECGKLESSKSFTRDLLAKYGIPGNPHFQVFESPESEVLSPESGLKVLRTTDFGLRTIEKKMEEYAKKLGQIVVKADGLQGGKGVHVQGDHFQTIEEGLAYAKDCLAKDGRVVIEEKLIGQEFSLMSFCDGEHLADMPPIQDHKRAYDGDKGPNTGGMGTYNYPDILPFLTEKDIEEAHEINVKVAEAVKKETHTSFKGILYGGFIAVKNGVRLIEYNVRLGDPEAMNALTLLETDFVDICQAIIDGTLNRLDVRFAKKATVCKYAVPEGYPEKPVKGEHIKIGRLPKGVTMYLAAVDEDSEGLVMTGSRAVAFVGVGDTIEKAEKLAQKGVESVQGKIFYRKDIGTKELVQKRVDMMKSLRS